MEKKTADLVISNAREIITCANKGQARKGLEMREIGRETGCSIAISDGKITGVGKYSEIESEFETREVIDAAGKSVVPGFVECHTHIVFAGNRLDEFELKIQGADYLEILEAGGGILSTVEATRKATSSELFDGAFGRLDKMMNHGVTTCEIKTGYGLDTLTELKMLDVIFSLEKRHAVEVVATFLPAHAIPSEWKGKEDDFTDLICEEMIPAAAAAMNALNCELFIDVFCEKGAFNLEQSKRVILTAKGHGLKIKAHVDEFTNLGGARFAIENGAVSIDHLDATSDEEIELLAGSGTVGVVTPTVNFNFGSSEFADARKMIDSGCAIALSTDYNPGSAPCPSLQTAMAIACRYQKMLPAEAITAVTTNGAAAVGKASTHGSIEVGKQADILILSTGDYREICYEFGGNFVETVIKKGLRAF